MKWFFMVGGFVWIGIALSFQSVTDALICLLASVVMFTGAGILFELEQPRFTVHAGDIPPGIDSVLATRRAIQHHAMTKGRG